MGWNAHDRAGAVIHQNVIRDPDRHLFAVVGIHRQVFGIHAMLFDLAKVAAFFRFFLLGDELLYFSSKLRVKRGKFRGNWMFGSKLDRRCSVDRIDARSEHGNDIAAGVVEPEINQRTFAAPDPVALHGAHFFRPAGETVQIAQQFLRVIRSAKEPLLQFALLNQRVFVAPAASADDLFVGQHSATFRAPVDLALFAISQPALVHLQKKPLVPSVIFRKAGSNFARPVVGEAQPLHLHLHVRDVTKRPFARRNFGGYRGVFRRQAERIPSHGMQDVVAVHPHVTGKRVANRVIAHVPHVQRARRIWQHLNYVILRLGRIGLGGVELSVLLPARRPLFLDLLRIVALVAHDSWFFLLHG